MTAPYILNYGAELTAKMGFQPVWAVTRRCMPSSSWRKAFTIYGMPLTTSNFYDSFRYGSLPIGVSNFTTISNC